MAVSIVGYSTCKEWECIR